MSIISVGMIIIVLLLGLIALGILAYVLLRNREGKFSLGGFFSLIFSAILVFFVVVMMTLWMSRSAPPSPRQAEQVSQRIESQQLIDTDSPFLAAETIPVTTSAASVESGSIMRFSFFMIIASLLGLFAFAILAYVLLRSRDGKFSLGGFFSLIFSAILVLPVVAVLAYLLAESAPQFKERAELVDLHDEDRAMIVTGSPVQAVETIPVTTSEASVERDPNLPEWVGQPDSVSDEAKLVSLSSQQYVTVEEAESELLAEAMLQIQKYFHKTYSYKGDWAFPEGLVEEHYLGEPYVEKTTGNTENATFEMVRVHRQLMLSPKVHEKLYPVWREQIVERRLWALGSLLGVFTLILGSTATYLRLDAATSGAYRLRLKLATVALIVAGGMGVAMMLPVG
jgi:uncharacterized membrane protein